MLPPQMVVDLPIWLRLLPLSLAIAGTGIAALLVLSTRRIIARLDHCRSRFRLWNSVRRLSLSSMQPSMTWRANSPSKSAGRTILDRCPNCRRYFSDDERGNTLMYDSKFGVGTCSRPACMDEVTEINKAMALHQG